ncbi:CbtB-domain containing protein [Haloechinothrix halophila]|uniref:CbtB-domain containing protein n=1 Tax=Haloechinothrix halophila TaxID=1069073 RepID=UPI000417BDC3|nr:CbtB-domain containing protein [Haloechinothrix halophila]
MSEAAVPASTSIPSPVRIPLREIVPWAVLIGALAMITMFFISTEDGATTLLAAGGYVHEFLHDGRHLMAFPCH